MLKRYLIPAAAFLLGSGLISGIYLGFLGWAQGIDYAIGQFLRDRWYVVPIIFGFGVQAALYSILRFRLFIPKTSTSRSGTVASFMGMMGTSGTTSTAAMVACCIHHVTDVLPILGFSVAASYLARYQRPFMLVGLMLNIVGILVMLVVLYRERQKLQFVLEKM